MSKLFLTLIALTLATQTAHARPTSYAGGTTVMTMNDIDTNTAMAHYSFTPKIALGVQHDYLREENANADSVILNLLLKRWNMPASQANFYLKSGAGIAYKDGETDPAAFTGFAIDWEDRRYFVSYENKFMDAGDIASSAKHSSRIGIAPYIGDAGDLHTWLMVQTDYDAGKSDSFSATPLIRLFKGSSLLEAGYNLDGGVLFNFTHNF